MKKLLLFLTMSFILMLSACGTEPKENKNQNAVFQATVLEIHDNYYLVEPVEGSSELSSSDQITVSVTDKNISAEVGDIIEIEYDGSIAESYPAQITNVYNINIVE